MEFKFLDKDDALLFVRADAIVATIAEHEQVLRITFPFDIEKQIDRGMSVIFTDEHADGTDYERYFQVRNVVSSCVAGTQEIEAEDLMLAEMSGEILPLFSKSQESWSLALNVIFNASRWNKGNTLATLPADSIEYDMYEITRPNASYLDLRSAPRSTSTSLGRYNNGTLVREVSDYNADWKVVTVGSKTGYMYTDYLTFDHTVTSAGLPTITMTETYKTHYALMTAILNTVGLRAIPRLVATSTGFNRYADFDLSQMDSFNGARIEIDRDAYTDKIEYDDRNLYTRVYPTGKDGLTIDGIIWDPDSGDPGFSSVDDGWLEDLNASALYGNIYYPRATHQEFSDIDDPEDLINAAWAFLQTVNHPKASIELQAYDLASLGYGGRRVEYGERVNVILQPIGALFQLNVVQLTRDLLQRANTQITIGAFSEDAVSQAVSNANTLEAVQDDVKAIKTTFLDKVYPVGSIYMAVVSTDPGTLFGGTWAQIKDRFLLADGDTYDAGNTGGASTHKHLGTTGRNSDGDRQGYIATNGSATGSVDAYRTSIVDNSGSSASNITVPYTGNASSMPPYLVVYIWKRTA